MADFTIDETVDITDVVCKTSASKLSLLTLAAMRLTYLVYSSSFFTIRS